MCFSIECEGNAEIPLLADYALKNIFPEGFFLPLAQNYSDIYGFFQQSRGVTTKDLEYASTTEIESNLEGI